MGVLGRFQAHYKIERIVDYTTSPYPNSIQFHIFITSMNLWILIYSYNVMIKASKFLNLSEAYSQVEDCASMLLVYSSYIR